MSASAVPERASNKTQAGAFSPGPARIPDKSPISFQHLKLTPSTTAFGAGFSDHPKQTSKDFLISDKPFGRLKFVANLERLWA
jgi:hypothetical protein